MIRVTEPAEGYGQQRFLCASMRMRSSNRRPLGWPPVAARLIAPVEGIEGSVLGDWVLRAGTLDPQRGRVLNKRGYAEMVQRPGIVELNI
jgi:hypothetical protein